MRSIDSQSQHGLMERRAYKDGEVARMNLLERVACPYDGSQLCLRHWWLAGWHDRDMMRIPGRRVEHKMTPRKAAIFEGRQLYQGECKVHGMTDRYATTGQCVACKKIGRAKLAEQGSAA